MGAPTFDLLVVHLDLSPHTTHFHFPVIGCPDHSRWHEVVLLNKLCVSELHFVSAGAVPPVVSQQPGVVNGQFAVPGVEQPPDSNAERGQNGDVRSSEGRGAAIEGPRSMMTSLGIRNGRMMPEEPGVPN